MRAATSPQDAAAAAPASAAKRRRHTQEGTGIIGTLFGFLFFMLFLLFAVQVLVHLYAASMLTSAAFDAAQQVATSPGDQAAQVPVATAEARQLLGRFGTGQTTFTWEEVNANQVVLQVTAESPGFLPLPPAFRRIQRTVTVRTERFRSS